MKVSEAKKAEKLKKIISAAQKVFSEKGYHKATVDEIADQADVAKGTVYLYFPDKRALFDRILTGLLAEYKEAYKKILAIDDNMQAIKAYVDKRLQVYEENAQLIRISIQGNIVDEETKDILLKIHSYHLEVAKELIEKGIKKGIFKYPDAFSASMALNGIINQYALYHSLTAKPLDKTLLVAEITRIFFHGIV